MVFQKGLLNVSNNPNIMKKIVATRTKNNSYILSDETKKKISIKLKGRISPNKGKHLSQEHKNKLKFVGNYGKHFSEEIRRKISEGNKGKKISEYARNRVAIANHLRIISDDTRNKIGNSNRGKYRSIETRINLSIAQQGITKEEWLGFLSKNPYPQQFNKNFTNLIKKRDRNICFICQKIKMDNKLQLVVHHIDYNKNNCNLNNLITLCNSCHSKTNFNRKYWIQYFNSRLNNFSNIPLGIYSAIYAKDSQAIV